MRVITCPDTSTMVDVVRRLTIEGAAFTVHHDGDAWIITITGV